MRINRRGDKAIIEYREPNVMSTHLDLGTPTSGLTDREILLGHAPRELGYGLLWSAAWPARLH